MRWGEKWDSIPRGEDQKTHRSGALDDKKSPQPSLQSQQYSAHDAIRTVRRSDA